MTRQEFTRMLDLRKLERKLASEGLTLNEKKKDEQFELEMKEMDWFLETGNLIYETELKN